MNISVLKNFSWMVIEKIVSVFGLIFVTSYVAKYIGPSAFGTMAFAISVFGIVQAVSLFGTETIIFKRMSSNERSGIRLMLSAKKLRRSIFFVLATVLIIYFYFMTDTLTFVFCLAASIAAYFSQDVIAIYNDAALNSKFNAFANVIGLGVSLLLRLVVVHANLDIKFLAIPIITVAIIPYYIRVFFLKRGIKELMGIDLGVGAILYTCYMLDCHWRYQGYQFRYILVCHRYCWLSLEQQLNWGYSRQPIRWPPLGHLLVWRLLPPRSPSFIKRVTEKNPLMKLRD